MTNTSIQPTTWLSMDYAPKDGTSVRLLIEDDGNPLQDDNPSITIGSYGVNGGPDVDPTWCFAGWNWTHDCYVSGTGKPIGWLPLVDNNATKPLSDELIDDIAWQYQNTRKGFQWLAFSRKIITEFCKLNGLKEPK